LTNCTFKIPKRQLNRNEKFTIKRHLKKRREYELKVKRNFPNQNKFDTFFYGNGGSNPGPYIYYALFLPTDLSSREKI